MNIFKTTSAIIGAVFLFLLSLLVGFTYHTGIVSFWVVGLGLMAIFLYRRGASLKWMVLFVGCAFLSLGIFEGDFFGYRAGVAAQARAEELAVLKEKLPTVGSMSPQTRYEYFEALARLDPENQEYRKQRDQALDAFAAEAKSRKERDVAEKERARIAAEEKKAEREKAKQLAEARERAAKAEQERCGADFDAKAAAEYHVERHLKAPSTARFPGYHELQARMAACGTWFVRGYVDSQNGFGAMIRTHWNAVVRKEGDNWLLDGIQAAN